jgi:hypothetical protein
MDSYLALPPAPGLLLRLLGPLLPVLSPAIGRALDPFTANPPEDYEERSKCLVVAEARSQEGNKRVWLEGTHVYHLAASIIAWCAAQTLEPGFAKSGVLGPAEAFDPERAVTDLHNIGLKMRTAFVPG